RACRRTGSSPPPGLRSGRRRPVAGAWDVSWVRRRRAGAASVYLYGRDPAAGNDLHVPGIVRRPGRGDAQAERAVEQPGSGPAAAVLVPGQAVRAEYHRGHLVGTDGWTHVHPHRPVEHGAAQEGVVVVLVVVAVLVRIHERDPAVHRGARR